MPLRRTAAVLVLTALCSTASPVHADSARPIDWPLHPRPTVVTAYDPPPQRWLPGHRGVDLDASRDPTRTVFAAADGVVVFVGDVAGRGVLSIEHAGELRTTYEPVDGAVVTGARVRRGQPVATVSAGHPGCGVPWCLHWGLRRGRDYLDPTLALDSGRPVLKPVR